MTNTRYQYSRHDRRVSTYQAHFRDVEIGECWRDPLVRRNPECWYARIYTDPFVIGKGRTRDSAVDHAVNQIGGLD
jgi:hypothetical protein